MTVCPFCKAAVRDAHGPCPSCGKLASEHPSIAAIGGRNLSDDFDDADGAGDLEFGHGSVGAHGSAGSDAYDGGGMEFDDDLLDDGPKAGDLELDIPVKPSGAHSVPDLAPPSSSSNPSLPAAKISGSHPNAAISGSQPAAVRAPMPQSSGKLPVPAPTSSSRLPAATASSPGMEPEAEPAAGDVAPPPPPEPPKEVIDPAAAAIAKFPPAPDKLWQSPVYACKVVLRQLELRQDLESLRRRRSPDVPLYEKALKAYEKKSFNVGLAIVCTTFAILTVLFFMPVILRFANAPD